jgi:hypothetical protein
MLVLPAALVWSERGLEPLARRRSARAAARAPARS